MKKIICLLLSFFMIFGVTSTVFAAENEVCPVIYLPGIAASPVYANVNDKETKLRIPPTEDITEAVKNKLVPALISFSADRDADKLAGVISDEVNVMMADWFNNSDGTAKENSGTVLKYPATVSKNSELTFYYDWRGNPLDIAKDLHMFIEYVCAKSGSEKVAITCHSMGSIIATSYLSLFGYDRVCGLVLDTPALNGVSYVGDLLCGEVELTGESLSCFIKSILTDSEYEELVISTVDVFELGGIPEMLAVFLDDILNEIAPVIYKETLIPLFCYWPTIWAMCPDERINEAMQYVFDDICKDEDLSVLESKVDAYNTFVRENKEKTLLDFDVNARVAVISRYGFTSMPITESWDELADGVIDTKQTSLGATTAKIGDILSEEYIEGKDSKYISPDKTIDASTCLFPDKTWFIKGSRHEEGWVTEPLYTSLLFSETEETCDTYYYSRFLLLDGEELVEDTSSPDEKKELSPLMKLFRFLKSIFGFIIKFFKK